MATSTIDLRYTLTLKKVIFKLPALTFRSLVLDYAAWAELPECQYYFNEMAKEAQAELRHLKKPKAKLSPDTLDYIWGLLDELQWQLEHDQI